MLLERELAGFCNVGIVDLDLVDCPRAGRDHRCQQCRDDRPPARRIRTVASAHANVCLKSQSTVQQKDMQVKSMSSLRSLRRAITASAQRLESVSRLLA